MQQLDKLAIWIRARTAEERGATLVEYVLLITFIALVCVMAVGLLADSLVDHFNDTGSRF
jgi:Flp pilus assembly pilin Flp